MNIRVSQPGVPAVSLRGHFDSYTYWRFDMSIRIGEEAPDFTAETTEGTIRFHEWIGDK